MPPRLPTASPVACLAEVYTARVPQTTSLTRTFSTSPALQDEAQIARRTERRRFLQEKMKYFYSKRRPGMATMRDNYLGYVGAEHQPFPLNPLFLSQPVLGEETRTLIFDKVMERGETLKAVSAEMGVDLRRVAAVIRMKQIEKEWRDQGKETADLYARDFGAMLPQHKFVEDKNNLPFEPINDVLVHPHTTRQLFVPVSESRVFTRADAARAFDPKLQTVDAQSVHKQLIKRQRNVRQGMKFKESQEKFIEATKLEEERLAQKYEEERKKEVSRTKTVKTDRFEFRIRRIDSETVGHDGKSPKGTGWRYGVPFEDRKPGEVKIPTQVPEKPTPY